MTSYLYVLSIGPVQDFIAAARRTRDLWFGSHLLSEISKAAAKKIRDEGGELIFPSPENPENDLNPSENPDAFNVANIILAELDMDDVQKIQDFDLKAKDAAREGWLYYANAACTVARDVVNKDIWKAQVGDVIEFYSAWVPINSSYRDARIRLMRLHAARKATRDFTQPKGNHPGVDKSSLDGARESVLEKNSDITGPLALRMRRSKGEELCAIGLTKRLSGGSTVAFPSVVRVGIDPWIRGIENSGNDDAKKLLEEIGRRCDGENCYSSGTGTRLYRGIFPYDGQVLFPSRIQELKKTAQELGRDEDLVKLNEIEEKVTCLQKKGKIGFGFGEPDPYFAILVADGDKMGEAISNKQEADDHRIFSKTLAKFAHEARKIVEETHHGCMVYSGGDDVVAFLPVDTCIKAARELHEKFGQLLTPLIKEDENPPTLSVGIAIGHIREPLEDLRAYGHTAENDAKKPDRNGLAIHLYTRSGGEPLKIREQWRKAGDNGLDDRIENWVDMYLKDIFPDKAAYDLRQLAGDYRGWKGKPDTCLLKKDVKRLLKRKKGEHGSKELAKTAIEDLMNGVDSYDTLIKRTRELLLARSIAANSRQAVPPGVSK
jgi:CRISPR-associated protein Cmr2